MSATDWADTIRAEGRVNICGYCEQAFKPPPKKPHRRTCSAQCAYLIRTKLRVAPEVRFWRYVDKSGGANACWPWLGFRNPKGYGMFGIGPRSILAHRFAANAVESELLVCHHCDNRACCNPKHLFLGTQLDNMRDCKAKGRIVARRIPQKLTAEQVTEIRQRKAAGEQERMIAADYGIAVGHVWNVTKGRAWKHLPSPT